MIRAALLVSVALVACGRSREVPDQDLGGLVVSPHTEGDAIDLARAAKDPAELGRALMLPYHRIAAALGPHAVAITTQTSVTEGGKPVENLDDQASIEPGTGDTFHATYTNSADYGREVIYTGDTLYLRPRYQRWHGRAPESPEEPRDVRDSFAAAVGATWDLLAPGAALTDLGAAQVAGRAGRKIGVKLAPMPGKPAAEPLSQRAWRAHRSVDALSGEVVLDAEKGVPLKVALDGTIGFSRDGRRFAMKVSVHSDVSAIGKTVAIDAPAADQVVATPERLREVDDRDFLLQGIAPPLRKNPDGTAVPPQPVLRGAPAPQTPAQAKPGTQSKEPPGK